VTAWKSAALLAVVVLCARPARAQGRIELAAGVSRVGSADLGGGAATLTEADGGAFNLFSTNRRLTAATFLVSRVGVRIAPFLDLEARGAFGEPTLSVRVAQDIEGASPVQAVDEVREFSIAAVAVVHPERWRIGRRIGLFASAGAGYLRDLHEGSTLAQGGRIYLAGGGLTYGLTRGPTWQTGLRLDGGVVVRTGPAMFDARRASPLVGASFFARF
jgi:hypothetical protein